MEKNVEMSTEEKNTFNSIIENYEINEKNQRKISKQFLNGIILCLIICVAIFLSANFLSENRSSKNSIIEQIEADRKSIKDTLTQITDSLKVYSKSSENASNIMNKSIKDSFSTEYQNARKEWKSSGYHLRYLLDKKKYLISKNNALTKSITQNKYTPDLFDFISINSTRFGAILILIFMVQFLSKIYRYNLKLADFYGSRASILKLYIINKQPLDLVFLSNILSTDNIDIKYSKAPSEQAMDLAKSALDSITKTKS